jgi:hypothetical protein
LKLTPAQIAAKSGLNIKTIRKWLDKPRYEPRSIDGTREIRVILYAKDDFFCASAPAAELSIEDALTVEHDVIPLDGADVFQRGEIDSMGDRVALTRDPGDFARLPVDDGRQDQV